MKIDLHCHSQYSKRATLWIMQRLGCPESFTAPHDLYQLARQKGMTAVTITDHNVIDGALEIAHLPNTFISCEYTTYFPEDRCKIHVLAYDISESQHTELSRTRENIFEFVNYLTDERIMHACAHPLFSVNDRLTVEHIEQLILLFKNWEWNGSVDPLMNAVLQEVTDRLTPQKLEKLVEKYGICPRFPKPWEKAILGGSDDHSSLSVADTYTEVPGAADLQDFWAGIEKRQATIESRPSSPQRFGRQVYGIGYQFYKNKCNLEPLIPKDLVLRSFDGMLQSRPETPEPWINRLHALFAKRRRPSTTHSSNQSVLDILRIEARELILDDPRLVSIVRGSTNIADEMDHKWFEFVNQISNRALVRFGNDLLDRVVKAHFFDVFQSLASAGALYALLAPYFVGFSVHTRQRTWSTEVLRWFSRGMTPRENQNAVARLAHFTDTYFEVNGVARTLQQHLDTAQRTGKDYTVCTCLSEREAPSQGLLQFKAIGQFTLPEYPELKMLVPPFLEMLNHCYDKEYTHIHVSTPGPVGLAGLAIGRILQIPVIGTYHTALPEYAKALTEDAYVEDLMWRCMIGFYDHLDKVYVPSQATGTQLVERGIGSSKIEVYPRGCDIERFNPVQKAGFLKMRYDVDDAAVVLLYVGRVSKEKGLHFLTEAYRILLNKGHAVRLVVVGNGPYRKEMEHDLEETSAVFTGYLDGDDLPAVYAESDALVFPSATDTFGNVVLEAQSSGIPVIVTDKGGPHENIIPNETGIIVRANDAEALALAMEKVVTDEGYRKAMGKSARNYMESRSFDAAFEELWSMMIAVPQQQDSGGDPSRLRIPFSEEFPGARALVS